MAFGIDNGAEINAVASPKRVTLEANYLDLADAANAGWGQQYVPDLMEREAEVFGNRTVSGFLEMVGAEEPMAADQVVWSEQGRLHLAYSGIVKASTTNTITIQDNIDGVTVGADHGIRVGDTVIISVHDEQRKARVSVASGTADIEVQCYDLINLTDSAKIAATDAVQIFVYGSEYKKGTTGRANANEQAFKSYSNTPIIMKDLYKINGSDVSQIGWVEVSGEDGQAGYLWYLKAAGDTKTRFADYCEMAMIEAEKAVTTDLDGSTGGVQPSAASTAGFKGTEGLFQAITKRGNITFGDLAGTDAGLSGAASTANDMDEFDLLLTEFDKQGAIEEYMMFLNRKESLKIDNILASQNAYGAGGTSYGVFDNSEDMALNLGFNGFRRGSYDFYKTDWKYLNDKSTRGGLTIDANLGANNAPAGVIRGVMVPAGVSTVYDQQLGKNLKRPFLHVRYRASQMDDRRFKTWTTGSVGAATSDLDAMEMHFLTERCLVVQGANNFMLMRG